MRPAVSRPSWAEIDRDAISANVAAIADRVDPAILCAVIKADGYGHGSVEAARAAIAGGAGWLAVAVADEGHELRDSGIDVPVLVLSDSAPEALADAGRAGLTLTVSTKSSIERVAALGDNRPTVHLKVDTGMHRMGCDPTAAAGLLRTAAEAGVEVGGVFTHLAVADDPAQDDVTASQLSTFNRVLDELSTAGLRPPLAHAANSAGALFHPAGVFDMVRCGIAIYGQIPDASMGLPEGLELRPAFSLMSQVTAVRSVPAGDGVGYGWIRRMEEAVRIATVPLGYADGVPRCLGEAAAEVLIRDQRCPLAGRVTMDQLMVRVPDEVEVGDEVVLVGAQGKERVTLDDWATMAGTINYELLTGFGSRLPRRYV